jgi:hypothetical protein
MFFCQAELVSASIFLEFIFGIWNLKYCNLKIYGTSKFTKRKKNHIV